jgi:hypothetical protein
MLPNIEKSCAGVRKPKNRVTMRSVQRGTGILLVAITKTQESCYHELDDRWDVLTAVVVRNRSSQSCDSEYGDAGEKLC